MTQAAIVAQDLTALAFVALGGAIAYRWYRDRARTQGMLAVALITLAVVAVLGRFQDPQHPVLVLNAVSIVLFMVSGFFVLLFRHELIPLSPNALTAAYIVLAVAIVLGIVDVAWFQHPAPSVATAFGIALVTPWAVFTGEPILRLWLASNRLPAVQRARLRFLSLGFAILIVLLFVVVIAGPALRSATAIVLTQVVVLLVVPAIYVSFAPPALLRRIWRMGEENQVRAAMQDLLIFSPSREVLAQRAAFWAVRLVGATAGFVADPNGKIIATTGIEKARAANLLAHKASGPRDTSTRMVVAPLHLTEGQGTLAIVGGPFTPVFGSEEVSQLRAYASSVSAGLERARVTERMAALENNKTQFLNLASHELRGPVTVLRGYVSMLETGILGPLNDRGRKAAEVMAAKVSEMNELIEEMIEAARLEEGGVTLRSVEGDLRDITRSAVDVVKPLLEAQHELVLDVPDRRVRVNVDLDRTRTIITNLLSNAIKYSPNGGTITCQVRSRAGTAKVSITDEGIGIPRDGMATLFTRFGRVITPETEHLKGTGLGLFLGRQLARLQGGDITVASVAGKGSTFTLQLPTVSGVEPAVATEDGSSDGAPQPSAARGETGVRGPRG